VPAERLHDPALDVPLDGREAVSDPGVEEEHGSALRLEIAIEPERRDEHETEQDREAREPG